MAAPITLNDVGRQVAAFRNRTRIAAVAMGLAMLTVLGGLFRLQVLQYDHFRTLSQDNRVKLVPIAPTRGLIFSRDGTILAENQPSFSLDVTPEQVHDLEQTILDLRKVIALTDEDVERFRRELGRKRRFDSVTLRSRLTPEEVARFSLDRHRFPGVQVAAELSRHYPQGELFAHVVGYVGRIDENELKVIDASNYSATRHIGKIGVEQTYEALLHGQVGYQQVEVNALGRVIRVLDRTAPTPGKDLYLALDYGLQVEATAALAGRRGAVVAMDPETGGVLAMVSTPAFDPNLFVDGIARSNYDALRDSPDRPLVNRALQGVYPPGSTVKPLVGLAGLHYGLRTSGSATYCPGFYQLPGSSHQYRDWRRSGHGSVDLKHAIGQSCDVYFYRLAQDLGITRLNAFLTRFALGRRTGIDLSGEREGLVPSAPWKRKARKLPWYLGETLIAGIGQGFMLATPVQLATMTAAIGRRGVVVTPHVAAQIEDPVTHVADDVQVHEIDSGIGVSAAHWDEVIEGMHEVVQGPTGTARQVGAGAAYGFAGKTGTSQLFSIKQNQRLKDEEIDERLRDHALFVSFAPVEEPEIAIAVMVENGGGGSKAAAPIARRIMDRFFAGRAAGTQAPATSGAPPAQGTPALEADAVPAGAAVAAPESSAAPAMQPAPPSPAPAQGAGEENEGD
ncbi:MAG: penicillin-binding protein 2 [Gammaproteobacteria bacterium]